MAYATYAQYVTYMGGEDFCHVSEAEFPTLAARATEAIDAATMYKIELFYQGASNLTAFQTARLVQATCAQVEYYGIVGSDEAYGASADGGFAVGKVRVDWASGNQGAKSPKTICKAARNALAMTGLLYAGMATCE
jgi:hypothetical protein